MKYELSLMLAMILGLLYPLAGVGQVATVQQQQKLVAGDRAQFDEFGGAVSISGNYAIVGADFEDHDASGSAYAFEAGSAYIFELDTAVGQWKQVQKLVASDRAGYDQFGTSVSISGNYAIIGASREDEDEKGLNTAATAGSAYIFERDSSTGKWIEVQKLVASDRATGDLFGVSVSLSGLDAIVGAAYKDYASGSTITTQAGAAYFFKRNNITGMWKEITKVVASDRAKVDLFGFSVSISGKLAIVGALLEDEDTKGSNSADAAGSAYLFEYNATSGQWNEVQKIVASDRAGGDRFGNSVSISRNDAIVGAYWEDHDVSGSSNATYAGSAYLFQRNPATGLWKQVQKIVASDRARNVYFGTSVSIWGEKAVVGASLSSYSGAAYLFERDASTGSTWSQVQKIQAYNNASGDHFGTAVNISDGYVIIGASEEDYDASGSSYESKSGSAYIFKVIDYSNLSLLNTSLRFASCSRKVPVYINIKNEGKNIVDSLTLSYSKNSAPEVYVNYDVHLEVASDTVLLLDSFIISNTYTDTLDIRISKSNGLTDFDSSNNTVQVILHYDSVAPAAIAAPDTVCSGSSFYVSLTGSADSFTIIYDTVSYAGNQEYLQAPDFNVATTVMIKVEARNSGKNCIAYSSKQMVVIPYPHAQLLASDTAVCSEVALTFTATNLALGDQAIIRINDSSVYDTSSVMYRVGSSSFEIKAVLEVFNNSGCTTYDSITIPVYKLATASFSVEHACEGEPIIISNTSSGATSDIWLFGNGDTVTTSIPLYSYPRAGTYDILHITANALGCTDSFNQSITIHEVLRADFSISSFCAGEDLNLINNTKGDSTIFRIHIKGDGIDTFLEDSINLVDVILPNAGQYELTLYASNSFGCTSQATHTFSVLLPPDTGFYINIDTNRSITVAAKDTTAATYTWHWGDGDSGQSKTATHTYSTEGTYTISLLATSDSGCISLSTRDVIIQKAGITTIAGTEVSISAYPNPLISQQLTLELNSKSSSEATLRLYSLRGEELKRWDKQVVNSGTNLLQLQLPHLPSGSYILQVELRGRAYQMKIVK